MYECRYYGKCAGNCDGRGLVLGFGNETYDCDYFSQLPDVDALLALADEMDAYTGCDDERCGREMPPRVIHDFARRIRETCGEVVE